MAKNILFVCKHNAFRSKFAESIFKSLNTKAGYKVKSAGIISSSVLNPFQQKIGKSLGFKINGYPMPLKLTDLFWADFIIVVANDVPPVLFDSMKKRGKKVIVWKIPDARSNNEVTVKKILSLIEDKIKILIKSLK